ncbi:MAG: protein kinase [Planctomycetes bacterium]|nr:protein kinase [Planctomycetota bacterium]
MTSRRVGPYEVVRELGRGGMGVVLEVRHPDVPRPLALKLLLGLEADDEAMARFAREAQLLARVQHPNVVRVHTVGRAPEGAYIVSELVEGEPLLDRCRRGPLDPRQAAALVRDLARAVAAVHAVGVLHRDLKPHNVIVRPDGAPVLLDFGVARDLDSRERLTRTGAMIGTPAYMAPEQADGTPSGELDERVDVYGLGAVLFEALAGRPPFEGGATVALLKQVILDPPRWPAGLPPGLDAVLRAGMAKARDARPGSARALADDLDRWLRGERPLALGPPRRRAPAAALAAALVAAVALALAAAAVARRAPPPADPPAPPPPRAPLRPPPPPAPTPVDPRPPFVFAIGDGALTDACGLGGQDLVVFALRPGGPLLQLRAGRSGMSQVGRLAVAAGEAPLAAALLPGRRLLLSLGGVRASRLVTVDLDQVDAAPVPFGPDGAPDGPLTALACSADGALVLVGGPGLRVRLLRAADGALAAELPPGEDDGHPWSLRMVALSPDGLHLADASRRADAQKSWGLVRRWTRSADGAFSVERQPMGSAASCLAFGAGGELFVGLHDGTVRRWRWGAAPELLRVRREVPPQLSDDSLQGGVTDVTAFAHAGDLTGIVVLPDGALVTASTGKTKDAPAAPRYNELACWRLEDDTLVEVPFHAGAMHAAKRPYAGLRLAGEHLVATTHAGVVEVWPLPR